MGAPYYDRSILDASLISSTTSSIELQIILVFAQSSAVSRPDTETIYPLSACVIVMSSSTLCSFTDSFVAILISPNNNVIVRRACMPPLLDSIRNYSLRLRIIARMSCALGFVSPVPVAEAATGSCQPESFEIGNVALSTGAAAGAATGAAAGAATGEAD